MSVEQLQKNRMMNHLIQALEEGKDIGHYGRLVFVMVGRYFLSDEEIVSRLTESGTMNETEARALLLQVQQHGYNPPRGAKIREWQAQQEFPICPDGNDPDSCNPYEELELPQEVYESIFHYYEKKVEG